MIQDKESAVDAELVDSFPAGNAAASDGIDEFMAQMLSLEEGATILLYEQEGSGKEPMTFLDELQIDEYDFVGLQKYLRDTYGSGKYRIHLKNKQGRMVPGGNRLIKVKGGAAKRDSRDDQVTTALGQMMAAVVDGQRQLANLVLSMGKGEDLEDKFLDKLAKYKTVLGGGSGALGALSELRGALDVVNDLGAVIGSKSDDDSVVNSIVKSLPAIAAAMTQGANNVQAKSVVRAGGVGSVANRGVADRGVIGSGVAGGGNNLGVASVGNGVGAGGGKVDSEIGGEMFFKASIETVLRAAERGGDVVSYADYVIDNFPAVLAGMLMQADWFGQLCAFDRRFAAHESWLGELREHVLAKQGLPSKVADLYQDDQDEVNLTGESSSD